MTRIAFAAGVLAVAVFAAGCTGDDRAAEAEPEAKVSAAGALEDGVMAAGMPADAVGSPASAVAGPGITVVGNGTVIAVPDTAEWSFGVQTSADTAAAALAANSAAMDQVVAALREAGVAKDDLQTEQVSVWPRTSDDGTSVVGYDASNTARATIRDLDRAGELVDAAVAAGANQVYGPSLTVSDAEAQYAAAMDAAFDDARARAESIAEKAGVTLGAPVAIVEGAGGGGLLPYASAEMAAADVAIEPGTQDVGATLTVTFAIG